MDTDTDERIHADAVVLTTELPDTYRLLGRTPRRLLPLRPSAVVAHIGCRSVDREMPHHHSFRRHLGADVPRDHRRRRRDERSLSPGDQTDGGGPDPGAGGPRPALRAGARPESSRGTVDWKSIGSSYADSMMTAVADRFPSSASTPSCCTSSTPRTGPVRAWPRARRSRWHTRSGRRTVPSGQHRSRYRQRRAGRLVDRTGGRPDRPAVGTAGRRSGDRRCYPGERRRISEVGKHDSLRTRCRWCARSGLRDAYQQCRAQRRARQDVLPRHQAAGTRTAARSARTVRVCPAPTTSSTTSTTASAPGNGPNG